MKAKLAKIFSLFLLVLAFPAFPSEFITLPSGEKICEEAYPLKGGYRLVITLAVIDGTNSFVITVNDGKHVKTVSVGAFLDDARYYPRYEGTDFDGYFVITFFFGDYYHHLIEKKSGRDVMTFTGGTADTTHNLLIFQEYDESAYDYGDMYLLNLSTGKRLCLNPYYEQTMAKKGYRGTNWYAHAFEICGVEGSRVTIRFYGCYKPILAPKTQELIDSEDAEVFFTVEMK